MKKVFLSLAVIATLTVVSCKQSENAAEGTADTTVVADTTIVTADTTVVDTTVADTTKKVETTTTTTEEVKK